MKFDRTFKKAFNILFHLVLSLMLIDWAVNLPWSFYGIGIYEIAFALLGCVAFVLLCLERGAFFRHIWQIIRTSKWSALAVAGYLIVGVITLLYAQTPSYAITKYIVVVQMLFFGVCGFYYVSVHEKGSNSALMTIYANIGLSAVFAALWGVFKYFFFTKGIYPGFISPIDDYNQYTTILLIGLVSVAFFIIKSSLSVGFKYFVATAVFSVLIPTVSVSSSRRSFLLLFPIIAFLFSFALIYELLRFVKKQTTKRQFTFALCGILLCTLCVYAVSVCLTNSIAYRAGKPHYEFSDTTTAPDSTITEPTPSEPPLETPGSSAQDRLNDDAGLGKRSLIWKIAIHELQQYNVPSLLFGRGASHSADLYDNTNNAEVAQLQASYGYSNANSPKRSWMNPHNLFLQDLLDGGLVLLAMQLSIILSCVVYCIKILRKNFTHGCVLFLMFGILFVTLFLSCASGITSNKFFWLLIMILMTEIFTLNAKTN